MEIYPFIYILFSFIQVIEAIVAGQESHHAIVLVVHYALGTRYVQEIDAVHEIHMHQYSFSKNSSGMIVLSSNALGVLGYQ